MSDTQHTVLLDVSGLPPAERARRYRELADRHLRLGQRMISAEASAAHLELAALWTRLATEAERQAHVDAPDLPSERPPGALLGAPTPEPDLNA